MIYIATVHFKDARWIEPQASYLNRHLTEPYRVFASCQGVDSAWHRFFDNVVPSSGSHSGKLNLLAAEIGAVADPDDLLMFLDGDAFPIADPLPIVHSLLQDNELVAIRRDENEGDLQPHPSFCVTTVGTWRHLGGDWSDGYLWRTGTQRRTDVGGNLLRALERSGTPWAPLLRSNGVNLHPLMFGVYSGIVYHQGAGFREPFQHIDKASVTAFGGSRGMRLQIGSVTIKRQRARKRYIEKQRRTNQQLSDDVFRSLLVDPEFWRAL
jgi:hypothetical protein